MMLSEGLFDLQVNGYAGVDFNDAAIQPRDMELALEAMLEDGVTGCLPTIITAYPEQLRERIRALDAAVQGSRLGNCMVPGYHLEGPFLNAATGYAGCHPGHAMQDPDIGLFDEIDASLSRPVMLVTLAPERDGAIEFVRQLTHRGKATAIAHSAAGYDTLSAAAEAGMSLSTHLGNGLPKLLPKLENTLLAQLSEDRLDACFIADGHHVPPGALAAMMRIKGLKHSILVTDAVLAARAPVGRYRFADMEVERTFEGKVIQPGRENLAGSALTLDQAVRNVCGWGIADPIQATALASSNPRRALARVFANRDMRQSPGQLRWNTAMEPKLEELPSIHP